LRRAKIYREPQPLIALYESVESLDRRAVETFAMSEELLMEHAALAIEREIVKRFDRGAVLIVCGAGNNGADGLALARLLGARKNFAPKVYAPLGIRSPLGKIQLRRVRALGVKEVTAFEPSDIIVDALFGGGLNRKLDESVAEIIKAIDGASAFKIACDIPSGVNKEGAFDVCAKMNLCVTMGAPKLALFHDKVKDYAGEIVVADLGVPREAYAAQSDAFLLEESDLKAPFRQKQNSHKGTYGHLAVAMGDKSGAAILCAMAALRFGAGLATIIKDERHTYLPFELMQAQKTPATSTAIALGMGLGETYSDEELLDMIGDLPAVIDADALDRPFICDLLTRKRPAILTPHPKEFAALLDRCGLGVYTPAQAQERRLPLSLEFGKAFPKAILVLKGANTIITDGTRRFINASGTPALAKGGSGDALAGMIGAALAQGYDPLEAAINGSLAHALAAKRFEGANFAMLPSDLIASLAKL
jgi:hydroxyethylthiazole kinase-like uncharacterized protein yjeF